MSKLSVEKKSWCPFWSERSLKCRLCDNGLFIPLDDHIEVYCKTPEYPLCLQYNMSADSHSQLQKNTQPPVANRRTHLRVANNYRVTLVRLTDTGQLANHYSLKASTLDLSMGGMRLRTTEPLVNDTRISFAFDDSFPEELQSGTARIKWCSRQVNTDEYQAGLAFESAESVEAMGMYLGLHSRHP